MANLDTPSVVSPGLSLTAAQWRGWRCKAGGQALDAVITQERSQPRHATGGGTCI
ncbi:unnamed protein product [Miscanthus lutarioriparius]|uniref:Uncharacterized protein n=1 Tax=Miscanthus lutarioriparius TaxID=422564 RepID=A0A811Q556_9POAL|nr:unnamed protein product [Miscanthus lutarioriparius]